MSSSSTVPVRPCGDGPAAAGPGSTTIRSRSFVVDPRSSAVRSSPGSPPGSRPREDAEAGFLSLEWLLTVPVMFLLAALVVAAGYLVRDVLVLQEAARVGARTASTTAGQQAVSAAVHDAAPELRGGLAVAVAPLARGPGDHVEVVVTTTRRYGPLSHRLVARSTARVEPILDGGGPLGPAGPLRPPDPTAPRGAAPSGAWP